MAIVGELPVHRRISKGWFVPVLLLPETGTIQIPVDSSEENPGCAMMVICTRILKIHHHPAPTRGHTMKFIRRPDLDPQTRIHIVMLAWLHQGLYGKMTEIANAYRISRTFLYQLLVMATLQLETLFSD